MSTVKQIKTQIREHLKGDGGFDATEANELSSAVEGYLTENTANDEAWKNFSSQLLKNITQSAQPLDPNAGGAKQVEQLLKNLNAASTELSDAEDQLRRAMEALNEAGEDTKPKLEQQKQMAELRRDMARAKADALFSKVEKEAAQRNMSDRIPSRIYRQLGRSAPGGERSGSANFTSKAQTGNGAGRSAGAQNGAGRTAGQQGSGRAQAGGTPFGPPQGWGSGGDLGFSSDAYMKSLAVDDFVLQSFDDVLKNQNRGKQLMTLFYYFAQRAASGDLGQMYQFMKFITYIISKDKAKQQIDMGKKLIELQDESRRVTDILLNTKANAADPNSNNEFMKMMTWAKSQSDSVATSQKLIAQMMEEFATIVETLTNVTKGTIETWSRILRRLSSFGN